MKAKHLSTLPPLNIAELEICWYWIRPNGLGISIRLGKNWNISSVQFSGSVVSNSATPWTSACQASLSITNSQEFTQTHVHWAGDAIKPSHPLSSASPSTFSLSQHPGLFQWVSSLRQVAKVLELQLRHQSFQWIFRTDLL